MVKPNEEKKCVARVKSTIKSETQKKLYSKRQKKISLKRTGRKMLAAAPK